MLLLNEKMGYSIQKNLIKIINTTLSAVLLAVLTAGVWLYTDYKISKSTNEKDHKEIMVKLKTNEEKNAKYFTQLDELTDKIDSSNVEIVTAINTINGKVANLQYVVIKNNQKMKKDLEDIKKAQKLINDDEELLTYE